MMNAPHTILLGKQIDNGRGKKCNLLLGVQKGPKMA